jgi:hypothetical protein
MNNEFESLRQERAHHQLHLPGDRLLLRRFGDDIEAEGVEPFGHTEETAFIQQVRPLDEHCEGCIRGPRDDRPANVVSRWVDWSGHWP